MARTRWTDLTKRETNLSRELLASAKYTEKEKRHRFHLSDQRTGTKQKGNSKGNAIMYVSGFPPFLCVDAYMPLGRQLICPRPGGAIDRVTPDEA